MTQEQIDNLLKSIKEQTPTTIKFVLDYAKEKNSTKLLILLIENNSFQYIIGYRYDKNFTIPADRLLDYWENGSCFYSLLDQAIKYFYK